MTYKRTVKKDGKNYGPYIYESYRDESGKVQKRYLGKAKEKKINAKLLSLTLIFVLFLVLVNTYLLSGNFNEWANGKIGLSIGTFTGFAIDNGTIDSAQDIVDSKQLIDEVDVDLDELQDIVDSERSTGGGELEYIDIDDNDTNVILDESVESFEGYFINNTEKNSIVDDETNETLYVNETLNGSIIEEVNFTENVTLEDNITEEIIHEINFTINESEEDFFNNESQIAPKNITLEINESEEILLENETIEINESIIQPELNISFNETLELNESINETVELNINNEIVIETENNYTIYREQIIIGEHVSWVVVMNVSSNKNETIFKLPKGAEGIEVIKDGTKIDNRIDGMKEKNEKRVENKNSEDAKSDDEIELEKRDDIYSSFNKSS